MVAASSEGPQVGHVPRTRAEKLQAALLRKQTSELAAARNETGVSLACSADFVGDLPSCLVDAPRGSFESAAAPVHESLRDFARILLASERRVFIMTRGMVSMRPLQLSGGSFGVDNERIGEFSTSLLERVCVEFQEALSQRLATAGSPPLDEASLVLLQRNVARSMSANVGIDFTVKTGLVPTFLQPLYVLVFMGGAGGTEMQAHLLVYGFVAGRMDHVISSESDVKCTPFCACLMSPNLLNERLRDEESASRAWEYSVRKVSTCNSIREAAERDAQLLRQAVKLGRWDMAGILKSAASEKETKSGYDIRSGCSNEKSAVDSHTQTSLQSEEAGRRADASQQVVAKLSQSPPPPSVRTTHSQRKPSQKKDPMMSMFSAFWAQPTWSQTSRACATSSAAPLHDLSPQLAACPSGHFMTTISAGPESLRDFARVFLAKGNQRRVYVMTRGMVSMRPLQLAGGVDTSRIGDMDEEMISEAQNMFTTSLAQWLQAVGSPLELIGDRDRLCAAAAAAMSGSVGIDFSQHAGLLPMFMQPIFVLLILAGHTDEPPQARMLLYGFVAGGLSQIGSGRTETKSTPFCARLASPNLLAAEAGRAGDSWEWDYKVYRVKSTSIREAAERDAPKLREVIGSGKW